MNEPKEIVIEQGPLLSKQGNDFLDNHLKTDTRHPFLGNFSKSEEFNEWELLNVSNELITDFVGKLMFFATDKPELARNLNKALVRGISHPGNNFTEDPNRPIRLRKAGSILIPFARQIENNPNKWSLSSDAYNANIYYKVMNELEDNDKD